VDKSDGEFEGLAELGFAGGHFAGVDFVVHPGEVEEAVEEEDADFVGEGVAVFGGLAPSGVEGDGQVAGVAVAETFGGWEAEDVGGLIFAAIVAVEAAEGGVGGEQNFYFTFEAGGGLSFSGEAGEAGT
jgi:hypothetical protein